MKSTIWSIETALRHHRFSPGIACNLVDILPRNDAVIDLGCGRGDYLKVLSDHGFRCLGIEGTSRIQEIAVFENIFTADLSRPLEIDWPKSSVICLEVAEHLYYESESTLLDTIDRYCSEMVVLSWAIPGQRGTGHVNCRPNSYVYDKLNERGFNLNAKATFRLRESAEEKLRYFRNSLLVFVRANPS